MKFFTVRQLCTFPTFKLETLKKEVQTELQEAKETLAATPKDEQDSDGCFLTSNWQEANETVENLFTYLENIEEALESESEEEDLLISHPNLEEVLEYALTR